MAPTSTTTSVIAAAVIALVAVDPIGAGYTHNDPSGYSHPGCIASSPGWVPKVPSANRTCPGKSMEEVWDFDTEIHPFNKKVAGDHFDAWFPSKNLVIANDYNTPTFTDFVEPGNPPQITGYSRHGTKKWKYQFTWQVGLQTKTRSGLNVDIAYEWCNMTVIKEQRKLLEFIAESDSTGITVPTLALDSALRDDFHEYRRYKYKSWRCTNWPSNCDALGDPKETLQNLNNDLETAMTARNRTLELAAFDAYKATTGRISAGDYSFLTGDADDIDVAIDDIARFNEEIEMQVKAQYVSDQDARLQTFLSTGGYSATPTITAFDEDLAPINTAVSAAAEADYITDGNAALQTFLSNAGYTYVTGASITTLTPDLTVLNDEIEAQVEAKYVADQNTRMNSWQSTNGYSYVTGVGAMAASDISNSGYVTTLNAGFRSQVQTKYVNDQNARMRSWQSANGYSYLTGVGAMATSDISSSSYVTALNTNFENQVEARWKSDRATDLTNFLSTNAITGFTGDIDDAISSISTFNANLRAHKASAFLTSSGLAAAGVSASDFNEGNGAPGSGGFNYTAYASVYSGAAYSNPPNFAVTPSSHSYTAFAFNAAYTYTAFALSPAYGGYTAFTLAAYPAYVDFAFDVAYAHAEYTLIRDHTFYPYKLRMPVWGGHKYPVPSMSEPEHIDKHDMTKLFVYHKAWYYQTSSTCKPTCTGSMNSKTDYDTDPLAAPRVCDGDDTICPTTNAADTWEEFSLIVAAKQRTSGKHANCPVSDPCKVSPPPCFYVSTECVPQVVLDKTLDNSDTRDWENENQNEDEKYLHDPIMDINKVTTWKLVSNRVARDSPLEWNYKDGLVMSAFTSPVDNRNYHKVCTFALVSKNYQYFEHGVEYGFSIAEPDGKTLGFGHTEPDQDSYGQNNHVYDAGHVFVDREMWQRTFGETVAPRLDDTCSGVRAGDWRNRLYTPAQQFESQSFVFGTCARHCGEVASMGLTHVFAASLGAHKAKPSAGELGSATDGQNRTSAHAHRASAHRASSPRAAADGRLGRESGNDVNDGYRGAAGATGASEAQLARATGFEPNMPVFLAAAAACVAAAVMLVGAVIERKWFSEEKRAERTSLLNAA